MRSLTALQCSNREHQLKAAGKALRNKPVRVTDPGSGLTAGVMLPFSP